VFERINQAENCCAEKWEKLYRITKDPVWSIYRRTSIV